MNELNVIIISDDPDFARTLAGRWQAERNVPEITLVTSDICDRGNGLTCDLAIVGPVRGDRAPILRAISVEACTPVIALANEESSSDSLVSKFTNLIVVPQHDGWPATVTLLGMEVLRRVDATRRAQRAERIALVAQRQATLGRYMLEMRPSINNALTSMLGNADLLLLDPGERSPGSREQLRAIQTMALRLNEIIQRFSSLATEMWAGETESQVEIDAASRQLLARS